MASIEIKDRVLFVGNPGVGKSTLLNSLVGKLMFRGGVSFGCGLTKKVQWEEARGVYYGDTPGLADETLRQQAAQEIKSGLKMGGRYRLVFICTSESGRVRPDDLTTMQLVLEALPDDVVYGVIINKLTKQLQEKFDNYKKGIRQEDDEPQKFVTLLNSGHRPTPFILFNARNEQLDDEDDIYVDPTPDFEHFILDLPSTVIDPKDVKDIKFETFAQVIEQREEQLAALLGQSVAAKEGYKRELDLQSQGLMAQLRELQNRSSQDSNPSQPGHRPQDHNQEISHSVQPDAQQQPHRPQQQPHHPQQQPHLRLGPINLNAWITLPGRKDYTVNFEWLIRIKEE